MPSALIGLRPETTPATAYCTRITTTVSANTSRITPTNVTMIRHTWPATVMLRKMPKM